jgi:tricarballylate dehydrogenase
MGSSEAFDVVVVGAGNAGLCAALAARQEGARVLVLECAPEEERGGNSHFTAGAMRVAYAGVEELLELMPDLSQAERERTDFGSYDEARFFDDIARLTQFRADPDLADVLVRESRATLAWMRGQGIRFTPSYGRQAFEVDGRFTFWGGLAVEVSGGGPGLVTALFEAAKAQGVEVWYRARALDLVQEDGAVRGVTVRRDGATTGVAAGAVVLAAGGFEANAEWRTRYLGPGWDLAKVRGSRFNMGDGIRMALEVGALPCGNWSGCHAVAWDRNAPEYGDLAVGDGFQKHSYPLGIMVNALGRRFLDEGADFRNYTYAKYGRVILEQPGQFAWQIFDSKVLHLLRDEYRIRQVSKLRADSLEELAAKLEGVDGAALKAEIEGFNAAVDQGPAFNPNLKDGRRTRGLAIDKSNWSNPIDQPPFEAYAVTCGITFTFGGLKIDADGSVMGRDGAPIANLFAAGELVGGLFYFNYPGGAGLTAGAVFGRRAGAAAAQRAAIHPQ